MDWKLITFSKSVLDAEVKTTISNFGYQVATTDGTKWLNIAPEKLNQPTILLFDRDNFPRNKIITILDHLCSAPSVGVIAESCNQHGRELAYRCDDFIEWPCSHPDFKARLERVLRFYHPSAYLDSNKIVAEFSKLNLIGESPVFVNILREISRYSTCDAPVLVAGETGTGKELVARAIHYQSNRRDYPFIPVNCGAIPDNLIENELFGHEKGAYTDAAGAQQGLIEQARGGTLFLDEVDSLSQRAQISLLRFLQDQEFRPLGGKQLKRANVRIVAATNAVLSDKVANGNFRNDLYYRLHILPLNLPALRHRKEDILLLANHFLDKCVNLYGNGRKQLHPATLQWMLQQDWPGNIRELENFILREYLANDGMLIISDKIAGDIKGDNNSSMFQAIVWHDEMAFSDAKARVISEFEKNYLDWLLRKTGGNVSDAARYAGKERRALGKLLKKYAIDKSKYLIG